MQQYIPIAAGIVSTIGLLWFVWAARQPRNTRYVGPAADWWETLRSILLPLLSQRVPRIKWAYTLHEREYVGVIDRPPEEVEQLLWEHGFTRNPLAAYKTLSDETGEVGSWAWRESLFADSQLHVMLFPAREGTAVYAHVEPNAQNPFTALDHYRGVGYNPQEGAELCRNLLPDGVWHEP